MVLSPGRLYRTDLGTYKQMERVKSRIGLFKLEYACTLHGNVLKKQTDFSLANVAGSLVEH